MRLDPASQDNNANNELPAMWMVYQNTDICIWKDAINVA